MHQQATHQQEMNYLKSLNLQDTLKLGCVGTKQLVLQVVITCSTRFNEAFKLPVTSDLELPDNQ